MTSSQILAAYDRLQDEYSAYKAEALACGQEVVSFREYFGDANPKEEALGRLQRLYDEGNEDLY